MELHQHENSKNATHFNNGMLTIPSKPRNYRWHLARNSVYFFIKVRVAVRSRSYTMVDIGSDSDSVPSPTHVDSAQQTSSFNEQQSLISIKHSPTHVGSGQEASLSFNEQHSLISNRKEEDSYCVGNLIYFAPVTTFICFIMEAVKSIPTVIQISLAILSLGIGIKFHGPSTGWYDGGNIFISVFFTILISATINFKHNQVLNNPINERDVSDSNKPLEAQVKKLSSYIMKLGILVALLLLVVLSIHYFVRHGSQQVGIMDAIMKVLSEVISIMVIAKVESLQLAVTLTVSYSTGKMLKHSILIRRLSVWENLGSITVICSESGTLNLEQMHVTELWVAKEKIESRPFNLAPNVAQLLQEAVGLYNTRITSRSKSIVNQSTSQLSPRIFGCPIEKAIFEWGVNDLEVKMDEMSQSFEDLKVKGFDLEGKRSGFMARRKTDNTIQVHFKGAAAEILGMCSNYYDQKGMRKAISHEDEDCFKTIIQNMEVKGLKCIAFAQKQENGDAGDNNVMYLSEKENGSLSLLGIIGLAVPCETSVREAVELCRNAGVGVKLITEDDKTAATRIGLECGILNPNSHELHEDAVIEGTRFRNYSEQERLEKVDHIRVMASSSVQDKILLVQCLKQKQHIVAITGANSDDVPVLQEANVSLALGVESTEDVKQCSDIVILGEKYYATIVTIIKWGRSSCVNLQKVIQVQLTILFVGFIVSFISAISSGNLPPLWTNILLDTLLSLALATKQPTEDDDELMNLLEQPTGIHNGHKTIVSKAAWRNIIGQTLYQVTILLILQVKGQSIFGVGEEVQDTLIFNCFLLCQVFNLFNARKLEKKNIFEGITLERKSFWLIVGITVIVQFFMVELFCTFANTQRLTWGQWAACAGIAAFTWAIGWLIKCTTIYLTFCVQTILHPFQNDLPITNPCVSQKDISWGEQFKTGRIFTSLRGFVLLPFFSFAP